VGSQPESKLSRQIMTKMRARGAFVFKVHGGPLTLAGAPDICGVYLGLSVWVETKMPGAEGATAIQRHRHAEIRRAGGHVIVARSVAEVMEWMDGMDATHRDAFMSQRRSQGPLWP
jgi:hypothetical protein